MDLKDFNLQVASKIIETANLRESNSAKEKIKIYST